LKQAVRLFIGNKLKQVASSKTIHWKNILQ